MFLDCFVLKALVPGMSRGKAGEDRMSNLGDFGRKTKGITRCSTTITYISSFCRSNFLLLSVISDSKKSTAKCHSDQRD